MIPIKHQTSQIDIVEQKGNKTNKKSDCSCFSVFKCCFSLFSKEDKSKNKTNKFSNKHFSDIGSENERLNIKKSQQNVTLEIEEDEDIDKVSKQILNNSPVEKIIDNIQLDIKNNKYHSQNPLFDDIFNRLIDINPLELSNKNVQNKLIEFIKSEIKKRGSESLSVSLHLKDFKNLGIDLDSLEGQKILYDLALLEAQNGGQHISSYLSLYQVDPHSSKGLQDLLKIAKAEIKSKMPNGHIDIQQYGFDSSTEEGKNALIELARYHASQWSFTSEKKFTDLLGIYQIEGKNKFSEEEIWRAAISIIKECFKQKKYSENNKNDFSLLMKSIREFFMPNINSPETQTALIDIAKFALESHIPKLTGHLDVQHLHSTHSFLANQLKQFGIDFCSLQGRMGLLEMAKISPNVCLHLEQYDFDTKSLLGQQQIIQLAYFHVEKSKGELSKSIIKDFPIQNDEKERIWIEIAKTAALCNPIQTIKNLNNYGIDRSNNIGKRAWEEILKTAILQGGIEAFEEYEYNYINQQKEDDNNSLSENEEKEDDIPLDIKTVKSLNHLNEYLKIKKQDEEIIGTFTQSLPYFPFPEILKAIDNDSLKNLPALIKQIEFVGQMYPYLPVKELINLLENGNSNIIKKIIPWIISTAVCLSPLEDDLYPKIREMFSILIQHPNPGLRYDFSDMLIKAHASRKLGPLIKNWNTLHKNLNSQNLTANRFYALITLALASGISEGQDERVISNIAKELSTLRISSKSKAHALRKSKVLSSEILEGQDEKVNSDIEQRLSILKTTSKSTALVLKNADRANLIVKSIKSLNNVPFLSALEKQNLLEKIFTEKDARFIHSACLSLITIINIGKPELLKELSRSIDFHTDLLKITKQSISEILPISENIEIEKLMLFLNNLRDQNRFLLYFSRLKQLKTENYQELTKTLLEDVLNDRFPACRYEGSKHLQEVFKYNEKLKDKWIRYRHFDLENSNKGHFTVVNTDNLYDLLVCGTEVKSCLDILTAELEKLPGLFNYIHDGKIRLIAIKDENGIIIARAILRIMLTKEDRPVLLLDKIYPGVVDENVKEGILKMARDTATDLEVPLLTKQSFQLASRYPDNIYSLSTRGAPSEYVDAKEAMCRNEKFSLHSLYQIPN